MYIYNPLFHTNRLWCTVNMSASVDLSEAFINFKLCSKFVIDGLS